MNEQNAVVLDTDAWSVLLGTKRRDPRRDEWRRLLIGRTIVMAMQSRAEIIAGAVVNNWGARRLEQLVAQLDATATIPVTRDLSDRFAYLTAELRQAGHALHAKKHVGDRWVAATALHLEVPLLSGDRIYRGVPGLHLLTREADGGST